jgi:AbrB family looped-hinge helix DNA binding protein
MKAILSEKGQVTIPKPIRDRLGLRAGTAIEFQAVGGKLVGEKVEPAEDAVLAVTGIIKQSLDVDAYLAVVRGPAE